MVLYFSRLHPLSCFIYCLGAGIMFLLLFHPYFLLVAFVCLFWLHYAVDQGKLLKSWLSLIVVMAIIIFILNPILGNQGSRLLFQFGFIFIYLEGVIYGFTSALVLVNMLLVSLLYQHWIDSSRFLYLFGRLFPQGALIVMLGVRFVPLFKQRLHDIMAVQKVKGITLSNGTWRERLNNGMIILKLLLTWSLQEALQTADSMKARGYGVGKRSSYLPYTFQRLDGLLILLMTSLFFFCFILWLRGYGLLTIYPELDLTALLTLPFWQLICLLSFLFFLSLPLLVEIPKKLTERNMIL